MSLIKEHGKKYFCLNCFKIFRSPGECCDMQLLSLSCRARVPNNTSTINDWKRFIDLFLTGHNTTQDQLKRIIEIRQECGLNTKDQELYLVKRNNSHIDNDLYAFLDIKRNDALIVTKYNSHKSLKFVTEISEFVSTIEEKIQITYDINKTYFMVPVYGYDNNSIFFPQRVIQYNIFNTTITFHEAFDCFTFKITIDATSDEYYETRHSYFLNTEYSVRQHFLLFDTEEKAMVFRVKYLKMILDYFSDSDKDTDIFFFHLLKKESESDLEKILLSHPHLLI